MKFILDRSLCDLGIESVVIGIAKNVNPHAELSPTFLKKKKEREEWALNCDLDQVLQSPIIQGYEDILQRVGRSVKKKSSNRSSSDKKYPPSRVSSCYQYDY